MSFLVWNVRPEMFDFGSSWSPRWYGMFFAGGLALGNYVGVRIWRKEGRSEKSLSALFLYIVVGTVVGARLGHCLLYEPDRYLADPLSILNIRQGGLASHGGFLGVFIAMFFYLRRYREMTFLELADRIAMPALIGAICIRIGNFFNSEMIGPPTGVPWAIIFKRIDEKPRHPSMLYEALSYLLILISLSIVYRGNWWRGQSGRLFGLTLIACSVARFGVEFLKEDQVAFESAMILNMGQLLSLPFFAAGIYLVARTAKRALLPADAAKAA